MKNGGILLAVGQVEGHLAEDSLSFRMGMYLLGIGWRRNNQESISSVFLLIKFTFLCLSALRGAIAITN